VARTPASPLKAGMHPWSQINLVLGVLLGILLVMDRWPAPEAPVERLTPLTTAAVERVRIERGDRLTLSLERSAAGWRLTHPETRDADPRRVDQMLSVLRAPVRYGFAAPDNLDRFGVRPAVLLLEIETADGPYRLDFGDREPTLDGRYVLVDDGVRIVDEVFFRLLTLPPAQLAGD
jgi:hypothetical protein